MDPSELKNWALVVAAQAERDGFTATAEAMILLATTCAKEARSLLLIPSRTSELCKSNSTQGRARSFDVTH